MLRRARAARPPVALIASDQRMPAMTGIEFLEQARALRRGAKLVLLTAYADTDVAIKAINDIGLDYYLLKPWDPPEERLYPVLDDLLSDWQADHLDDAQGVRVVGHRWSERSHEIKTFLDPQPRPVPLARPRARREARRLAGAGERDRGRPAAGARARRRAAAVAVDRRGRRCAGPAHERASSRCTTSASSAAVPRGWPPRCTARRRGSRTVVVEREAPGGQAGQSAAIENYLGFPSGLSGADLTHRAVTQARRFGAEMVLARDVVGCRGPRAGAGGSPRRRQRDRGPHGRSWPRASRTGCSRRRGSLNLTGRGVYYGADASDARAVRGRGRVHRRRRELGGAGGAELRPLRPPGRAARAIGLAGEVDVAVPRRADPGRREHRGAAADRGRRRVAATSHLEAITLADRGGGHRGGGGRRTGCSSSSAPRPAPTGSGPDVARDERGFVITGPELVGRDGGPAGR